MSITSFAFICLYTGLLILYYLIPKKMQWGLLLAASLGFFLLSGEIWLVIYPLVSLLAVYGGALYIHRADKDQNKKIILASVIVFCVFLLCILKYFHLGLLAPLGISFYTLTLLGYLIDVFYEITPPETNILKLGLFGYYFPTLLSGPLLRYNDIKEELYARHPLNYKQITYGIQRILWGFFKKLVISERLALIVNTVYDKPEAYSGSVIAFAGICFTLQLYTDFSGYMDIVIGISETFGISMPENFKAPFFARNIQEYWRRWHITLGTWLRNYLFYPLLRTKVFTEMPKKLKIRLGKKRAKQITVFAAMLILWFTIGYWHGGVAKYIIGSGILHWFYIVTGELLEPVWQKLRTLFHIRETGKGFIFFQRVRTFLLVTIGLILFRAENLETGARMLLRVITHWDFVSILNGTLLQLGLDWIEITIAVVSLVMLLLVSTYQEGHGSVRDYIAARKLPVRWILYYALLFYVILLGQYGPGYSASEFIYQGF